MDLSIVTTMYRSAPYLEEFYKRVCAAAEKITDDYEIIFVNDGSPDDSLPIVLGFFERDKKVRVIDLSRNFGHHKAIVTGLGYARGELIFLIDCDLEEDPEVLIEFYREWEKNGGNADVIYGVQRERQGNWFRRWSGILFYRVFNFLSGEPIPVNMCMTRLLSHRFTERFLAYKETEVVLSGLFQLTGFEQRALPIRKKYKGNLHRSCWPGGESSKLPVYPSGRLT